VPKLLVEIPEDVAEVLRLPAADQVHALREELASTLDQCGAMTQGKSRCLAGMDRGDFGRLLGERQVTRRYTEDDLHDDRQFGHRRWQFIRARPYGCPWFAPRNSPSDPS
jgi:hypothetical protein